MSQISPCNLFPFRFLISHLIQTLYLLLDLPSDLLTQVILTKIYAHCFSPNLRISFYLMYATHKPYPINLIVINLCNIIKQAVHSLFNALKLHTKTPVLIMITLIISDLHKLKSHNIFLFIFSRLNLSSK